MLNWVNFVVIFVLQNQRVSISGLVNASWWRHHLRIASLVQLHTLQRVSRYCRNWHNVKRMFFMDVYLCAVDLRGSERMLDCFSRQDRTDLSALLRLSVVGRFLNATQWHFRRFLQRNHRFVYFQQVFSWTLNFTPNCSFLGDKSWKHYHFTFRLTGISLNWDDTKL